MVKNTKSTLSIPWGNLSFMQVGLRTRCINATVPPYATIVPREVYLARVETDKFSSYNSNRGAKPEGTDTSAHACVVSKLQSGYARCAFGG
eukprot:5790671-Pyramimonas_sp.AAC.1